ncbi:MAG: TolB-like protein/tetratricopeptide (TPR) repeat protein [Glaciecola sp.]|uniref:tetratricopeptide repeat protein n=1 Tax=Congregibacter sp. TaxID=2744308 RepID=UPI0039E24E87
MSFLGELKRRNVFRVAGVYTVVAWLLVQVAATVEEAIALPLWFDAVVLSFLVIVFPIALIFAWAFELTPDGIKRTALVDEDESITAQTSSKLDVALIISFLLFAGAMVLPRFLGEGAPAEAPNVTAASDAAAEEDELVAPAVSTPPDASIAVMPFADLSPRGDQEYFADGISEELLNVLAKVQELKVAGRTSSFSFKGRNEDLEEIGRVLKVAHILEGSVRSQGDRVRVTAQLIQVSDGYHLWSETYDGNLSDIFAVQDDIAQQILVALKEQLVVEAAPEVAPATRTDVTAYGLFLEARDLIYTRDEVKLTRAKALLDQVISIDPEYAPSYAARAKAYLLLSDAPSSYGTIPVQEASDKAESDVAMALELAPKLADAHAVRGMLSNDIGNPDFALASLRRALELNPNSLDARNWLALSLTDNGLFREALDELAVLIDIDPLYPPAVNNAMIYSEELGDYEQAVAIGERFIALSNDPIVELDYRARIATSQGRPADALKLVNQIPIVDRGRPISQRMVFRYIALGEDPLQYGVEDANPGYRALTRALLGESQKALLLVEEALRESPGQVSVQLRYIDVLDITQSYEQLLTYFESQFLGDLNLYATRLRSSNMTDSPPFRQLALAARATGNESLYEGAMQRWRESIDVFRAGGSASRGRDLDDARYWAMRDAQDLALEFLEAAFTSSRILGVYALTDWVFASMRENPSFVAIRNANAARINEQRAQLDLEPLPAEVFVVGSVTAAG